MKYSKQREEILTVVKESCEHPTAEMVYKQVQKRLPNISLGTVYRNLNVLVENGMILKIIMPDDSDRFDKTLESHYHMHCIHCHQVYDIPREPLTHLNETVSTLTKHQILSHELVFKGICQKCK